MTNPIEVKSPDDFRARARINRAWLDQYYATLFGEIDVLCSEGKIKAATADILNETVKRIQSYATKMEIDYYELVNTLDEFYKVPLGRPS